MIVLAIDPGPTQSAYVILNTDAERQVRSFGKLANVELRAMIDERHQPWGVCAIEMIASYGMPVGAEVFDTCVWIGRYIEILHCDHRLVYRRDVKLHLCGLARAKDGNIRQAIIDRYGGKEAAIGRKATPGPLFGVTADVWQALAVAITYADSCAAQERAA